MAPTTLSALWHLDTPKRVSGYFRSPSREPLKLQNFIENHFLDYEHTSEWIDSFAPRSGKLLAKVPRSPANVVEYAVNVASRAFPAWSHTTAEYRSEILLRIASIMEQKKELFVLWENSDHGKPVFRARVEVERSIEQFRYFANYILENDSAVHLNKDLGASTLTYEHRVPVGIYAIVTSWNMPLYLLASKIAPCLAFGCTGVAKPSELASVTAFLFSEVLRRAELPPGVMNIVLGDGAGTGSTLVSSPLIQGVSFTGGVKAGIQIREKTAPDIHKQLFLEIKGSCPTVVFGDANMDVAAATAASAVFENSGQLCLSGSRIYVHRSVYEVFLPRLIRYIHLNYGVHIGLGPVISPEYYAKIRSYLVEASEQPANIKFETGDVPAEVPQDGFWIHPTILRGVRTHGPVEREIFGPVATVYQFDREEEVIRLCNDNPNGMGAVILTDDMARMSRVGKHLDASVVWADCWLGRDLGAGLTDLRATGSGQEGGTRGRDMFTRLRAVHVPSY
ncbi:hypothetical protein N7537_011905 [Penicillium hordei]|uniref:Aldehyde dehydrogenase domain-containing protein n=1 Tax=Penicillium hordei TaxID=40994 RepID=A0AAD6DP20_9EURO|nr:uncharacterized protein N7537_011905 [Penicillium hordei]KAJ5589227.1 hypothetical protein N7537_011905 [Penicillium hordei]